MKSNIPMYYVHTEKKLYNICSSLNDARSCISKIISINENDFAQMKISKKYIDVSYLCNNLEILEVWDTWENNDYNLII